MSFEGDKLSGACRNGEKDTSHTSRTLEFNNSRRYIFGRFMGRIY
jgi:hypothetical protein